jgi:hypothetical protein
MKNNRLKKRISIYTYIILGLLVLEIAGFGIFNSFQPSYKTELGTILQEFQAPGGMYYNTRSEKELSLEATYSGLSIKSILNLFDSSNNDSITDFITSFYDNETGLFKHDSVPSIEATYSAIGSLSILNNLQRINTSKTIISILKLQTNDSLFRDYNELNQSLHSSFGELGHLFEAVSILDKLFNNQTEYYLAINRTEIALGLLSLQENGGFKEGIGYPLPTMRNAYYVTGTMAKLGPSITFYESLGFQTANLQNWIDNLYTEFGFKFHALSEPSIEATAYAIISLERLGLTPTEIYSEYQNGIEFMLNFVNNAILSDESEETLDIIHDVLFAFSRINTLDMINRPYIRPVYQTVFSVIIGITFILLFILVIIGLIMLFEEDEIDYYESALKQSINKVYDNQGKDLTEISFLLGERIDQILFVFQEEDNSIANLRAISENYEFIIQYETVSWLPKKLFKYIRNTSQPLIVFDFLDREVYYKIDEAITILKEAH